MCTMNTAMFSKIYGKEKQFKAVEPLCAANRGMVFKTESIWERGGGGCSRQKRSGVGGGGGHIFSSRRQPILEVFFLFPVLKMRCHDIVSRRKQAFNSSLPQKQVVAGRVRWWWGGGGGGRGVVRWWVGSLGCGRGLSAFVRTVSGLNIGTFCFLYCNSHSEFRIFTCRTFFLSSLFQADFFL